MLRLYGGLVWAIVAVGGVAWAILGQSAASFADSGAEGGAWEKGHYSQTRLVGGRSGSGQDAQIVLGVQIALSEGWKTYWRSPGDAGGVPPEFDWSKSVNVASRTVMYPSPKRFVDRSGSTVGYKDGVVFPVRVSALDPKLPMQVRLDFNYGICREICVPVQAQLSFDVPVDGLAPLPEVLSDALARVPRGANDLKLEDPRLTGSAIELAGAHPKIVLDADFGGQDAHGDVFVEVANGVYVPMAVDTGKSNGQARVFEVDLLQAADISELKGQVLVVTLVSKAGQSVFRVEIK